MALRVSFCLWMTSLMPRTLLRKLLLAIAIRGRVDPSTPFSSNAFTYCGSSTQLTSHSMVSSIVQLCTSDTCHDCQSSSSDMYLSLPWNFFLTLVAILVLQFVPQELIRFGNVHTSVVVIVQLLM
uniref:Secreted protein n=1 Tax=Ixodes ricinus TaxID=34613 RepID=A0A6B0UP79_IXORI